MSDESADKTQPGPYSDKSGTDNTQYGNIAQIKADIAGLKVAVDAFNDFHTQVLAQIADLEAKTEPLQDFTNRVNQIFQRLSTLEDTLFPPQAPNILQRVNDLVAKVLEIDGRYQTKLGALEQRINALFGDGGVAAFVEDRIKIALGVIDQRIAAMDNMGKVGQ